MSQKKSQYRLNKKAIAKKRESQCQGALEPYPSAHKNSGGDDPGLSRSKGYKRKKKRRGVEEKNSK